MRTMSNVLKIFALLILAAGGYFAWYAAYAPNPNDQIGVAITRWMPAPIREWGCGKLNERFPNQAPTECSPAAQSTSI